MNLPDRLRKIREYRGLKQSAVAMEMNVSQQAYSNMENNADNAKMDTIQRFCNAMKVELAFVLALDVPVNDENLRMFDTVNLSHIVEEYKKIATRLSVYQELLSKKEGWTGSTQPMGLMEQASVNNAKKW